MLRWRLTLGTLLVVALVGLCWLDGRTDRPGILLAPLALTVCVAASGEMLRIFRAVGHSPSKTSIYVGPAVTVAASCIPILLSQDSRAASVGKLGFSAAGLLASMMLILLIEIRRFSIPGDASIRVGLSCLATLYVGGLISMLVQLRMLPAIDGSQSLLPLGSMIFLVKLSDSCQYFVGRSLGKHRLAPAISPGKTWEGAIGGIAITIGAGAWAAAYFLPGQLLPACSIASCSAYGAAYALCVSVAGLCGDLSESLLKRDAQVKDSSAWLPGFGGILDLLDSLLFAAPVSYIFIVLAQNQH